MIDRFAQIALRIGKRLARLAHHQPQQSGSVRLEQVRSALEDRRALGAPFRVPGRRRRLSRGKGRFDCLRIGAAAGADHHAPVVGGGDLHDLAPCNRVARHDRTRFD